MSTFKIANILFFGYIALIFGAYVFLRVCTKAVANSWYEVKLKKLKEIYHGEKQRKEKEKQPVKK